MALPAPNLDDRTFQDIVDEAKRLIPRYTPEWTNHNLSDPGVALIELFAWMSEMVLFRVNQVPDRLFVHFLNLVGIEPVPAVGGPRGPHLLAVRRAGRPVTVPAGMQVTTARDAAGEQPVVFTTVDRLDIAPPELDGRDDHRRQARAAHRRQRRPALRRGVGRLLQHRRRVRRIWCPATRCCSASPDRWPGSRSGCR